MIDFSDIRPEIRPVFSFFSEISAIPHGSGNTAKIADYLENFAKERDLDVYRDKWNNVLIRKPATAGFGARPAVVLQGHIDMVAEKTADCPLDMTKDGLEIYRDGDFLRAKGTTLGGDDGIAVAYALAILDSDTVKHPMLEALFTSDEETGLIGATGFDLTLMRGRTLINIDSESEGVFTVGCAGGIRVDCTLPLMRENAVGNTYCITLEGFRGGHSGTEINSGRLNAIKSLSEAICDIYGDDPSMRICSFDGGNADNAIPRSAKCVLVCAGEPDMSWLGHMLAEMQESEPDATLKAEKISSSLLPMDRESGESLLDLLVSEPTGVMGMSEEIHGLVETSLNIGILETAEDSVTVSFSLRSSKDREKAKLEACIENIAKTHGASVKAHSSYPAWEYKYESHLRDVMIDTYTLMYRKQPKVITIHAGLECGIFTHRLPGLDCISLGPDNFDIHTTEEHLSISSSARVYEFLLEVLENI